MFDPDMATDLKDSITDTISPLESIPTSYVVLRSLYCDWTPLPPGFLTLLRQPRPDTRHWRVSRLMSMAYLRANDCIDTANFDSLAQAMKEELSKFLDASLDAKDQAGSEFVETVGGLYYGLGRGYVEERWAQHVIAGQQPDGTWLAEPEDSDASDLTAAWGLLVVLEFTNPEVAAISPIIERNPRSPAEPSSPAMNAGF